MKSADDERKNPELQIREQYYEPGEEDLEDYYEEACRQPGPLSLFPGKKFAFDACVMFFLFALISLVYWQSFAGDYLYLSGKSFFVRHEYWRLVTAVFTHADAVHLLSNMPLFIIFGWMLRAYFGRLVFPFVSFVTGLISMLTAIFFYEPDVRLIGASGMNYGMVALWIVFYIKFDSDHFMPVRIVRAAGFSLIMLFPGSFHPETSYLAHAAGFFSGILAAFILLPFVRVREENLQKTEETGS